MSEDEKAGLSKQKRVASNLVFAIGLVLTGIVLLICGIFDSINSCGFFDLAIPLFLISFFAMLFIIAFIQKNTVALYLSMLFLTCGIGTILGNFSGYGYEKIYPVFIASPAVASFATMFMSREFRFHLWVFSFFGIISAIFMLQTIFDVSWGIIIPITVVFVGA